MQSRGAEEDLVAELLGMRRDIADFTPVGGPLADSPGYTRVYRVEDRANARRRAILKQFEAGAEREFLVEWTAHSYLRFQRRVSAAELCASALVCVVGWIVAPGILALLYAWDEPGTVSATELGQFMLAAWRLGDSDLIPVSFLVQQYLYALHLLHRAGVAHNDVKVENAVYSSPPHRLLLIDLGAVLFEPDVPERLLVPAITALARVRGTTPDCILGTVGQEEPGSYARWLATTATAAGGVSSLTQHLWDPPSSAGTALQSYIAAPARGLPDNYLAAHRNY